MNGIIIKDWENADHKTPEGRAKIMGALQHFLQVPSRTDVKVALQQFTTAGDFPESAQALLDKFRVAPAYDNAYEQVFDVRNFASGSGFDMADVESGLSFAKIPEGGKVKYYQMSGTKTRVYFDYYGAGLSWHRSLFENQEYWTLEDNAVEFRNKAYHKRSLVFNGLIEAMGSGINVAWTAASPSVASTDATYTANRDAQTLKAAYVQIAEKIKGKGYSFVAGSTPLTIYTPYQLLGRINAALQLLVQPVAGSGKVQSYPFNVVVTGSLVTTSVYYVCFPKGKNKAGYRMDLTVFTRFEQDNFSDESAGWMSYGGAIGDTEQWARCAIA